MKKIIVDKLLKWLDTGASQEEASKYINKLLIKSHMFLSKNVRIALDIDDVLAAFTPYAHKFHNVEMGKKVNYWCPNTMESLLGKGWFQEKIAPVEQFWLNIPRLSNPEDIDFPVFCYISAFPEEMWVARQRWLIKNGFPFAPLICTFDKLEKCIELGVTHLIDDKPDTIKKLQGSPVTGIHFITSYCGFSPVGNKVITNLNQVKNFL